MAADLRSSTEGKVAVAEVLLNLALALALDLVLALEEENLLGHLKGLQGLATNEASAFTKVLKA